MFARLVAGVCRFFLVGIWLALPAHAQDALSELNEAHRSETPPEPDRPSAWRGFLGAGLLSGQTVFGESRTVPVPLVSVSYRDTVYWQIARGGVWLFKSDDRSVRLGLAVKLRRGYDPDDVDHLAGMQERDRSVEAGVTARWATRPLVLSAAYYTDVSGTTKGDSASLAFSVPFRLGERWRLSPSISAEWLSAKVVDYYYGVQPSEATATRPAYKGKNSVNLRAGVGARYLLARSWLLFVGASYTHLGVGIADSPIVERSGVAAVHGGVGWRF